MTAVDAGRTVHADELENAGLPGQRPGGGGTRLRTPSSPGTQRPRTNRRCKIARSADAGSTFAMPVVVDQGMHVQGRVDVALIRRCGLAAVDARGRQWPVRAMARYTPDLSRELQRTELAKLQGRGRATGFPKLALSGDGVYVVWTDVVDGKPGCAGARYAASP